MTLGRAPLRVAATALASALLFAALPATAQIKPGYEFKKPKEIAIPGDTNLGISYSALPSYTSSVSTGYVLGFEAVNAYDAVAVGRGFIPPDTMGAVGKTQFMAVSNGVYAVYDKNTGSQLSKMSDVSWWASVGQTGANGDSRLLYNAAKDRWVAISFGSSVSDIQIAVSDTSDALGSWKSTKFTGFAGGTADYPTLAMDASSLTIGTNNFKVGCSPTNLTANAFCGTTVNVIPLDSLFNAGAPTTANMKQFVNDYRASGLDNGFAVQGVNSSTSSGRLIANSLFYGDNISMQISGLNSGSATGGTLSGATYLYNNTTFLTDAGAGRQPSPAIVANQRVVAVNDQRIASTVHEVNGRIYMVQTVKDAVLDEARVRYTVIDSATNAVLDTGTLGGAGYDYYEGSIAVNKFGQVVIGYNRSGLSQADADGDGFSDGNITFMAQAFATNAGGHLVSTLGEMKLKVSLTDDYHNGSIFGNAAVGRQRWGDYSQVTVDPTDPNRFYAIGEFAREYNNAAGGHPGGTGGSRWSTWVAVVDVGVSAVPEPSTYALMALGLAGLGFIGRRRERQSAAS